jgi:transcription antitermination protein NusB
MYFMKTSRSELRDKIVTILYQVNIYEKCNVSFDIDKIIKDNYLVKSNFIDDIVYGVIEKKDELTKVINKYMSTWTLDRLGLIDQAILLISTYEILYYNTPNVVCINEAIELAKKYSDDKVVSLINAVLDKILDEEVKDE